MSGFPWSEVRSMYVGISFWWLNRGQWPTGSNCHQQPRKAFGSRVDFNWGHNSRHSIVILLFMNICRYSEGVRRCWIQLTRYFGSRWFKPSIWFSHVVLWRKPFTGEEERGVKGFYHLKNSFNYSKKQKYFGSLSALMNSPCCELGTFKSPTSSMLSQKLSNACSTRFWQVVCFGCFFTSLILKDND